MSLAANPLRWQLRNWACGAAFACAHMGMAQAGDAGGLLTVHGVGSASMTRTIPELTRLPTRTITVTSEKGLQAQYRCANVADVLTGVGVDMGTAIKGKRFAETLKATARDGYEVVFALPELDPAFTATPVQLCFEKNGASIPDDEGPLRLLVEKELRHGRWVRQLVALTWVH